MINFDQLTNVFFSFPAVSVQKMPQTVQTVGQNLFLGRTCLNEYWWVFIACLIVILLSSLKTPADWALNTFQWSALLCFQSPPKGEASNEENKEVSAAPASEPSSQEATPEKGKNTITLIEKMFAVWLDC